MLRGKRRREEGGGGQGGGDEGGGEYMPSTKRATGDASDGRVAGLVVVLYYLMEN